MPRELEPCLDYLRVGGSPVEGKRNAISDVDISIAKSIGKQRPDVLGMCIRAAKHQHVGNGRRCVWRRRPRSFMLRDVKNKAGVWPWPVMRLLLSPACAEDPGRLTDDASNEPTEIFPSIDRAVNGLDPNVRRRRRARMPAIPPLRFHQAHCAADLLLAWRAPRHAVLAAARCPVPAELPD